MCIAKSTMWNTHDESISGLCTTKKKCSNKSVYDAFQKCLKEKKVLSLHQKGGDQIIWPKGTMIIRNNLHVK